MFIFLAFRECREAERGLITALEAIRNNQTSVSPTSLANNYSTSSLANNNQTSISPTSLPDNYSTTSAAQTTANAKGIII